MISSNSPNRLRQLMQQVGLTTYKALSEATGVSEKQIRKLRRGQIAQMRVETLEKLGRVLQVSVGELVGIGEQEVVSGRDEVGELRREYDRLQAQLLQQRQELWQEFQQSSVQVLESLLLQLPTAAYAAQQNPQAPAVKLLPLLRPIEALLQHWGIEAIAAVGSEVPYDPQQHQLMEGTAAVGDRVRVRYTGYRQGDKLLYRAKVSPVVS
ncbi:MAG: helix-turn-helix transcriptional regulator [Leptolyngbyaceae cyanobacterium]|uniref:helix-turn-helix domain-containing protein n=1 Tax=Leptodesmis sichuanensis TaxID=2906798 RepID=UPI001F2AD68D|nr:helix-turn-helix transcriptional regulator [Leptodesmis sichuanensis]UIE40112.1 helix-turn-helix transcriptional regulator [Leptodesmis sichuanensis A121]